MCIRDSKDLERDFRELPRDLDVAVGGSAQFTCSPPKGNPVPIIVWKKVNFFFLKGTEGGEVALNSL